MNIISKIVERASLLVGTTLVVLAGLAWIDGVAHSRSAVADFAHIKDGVVPSALRWPASHPRRAPAGGARHGSSAGLRCARPLGEKQPSRSGRFK